MRPILAAAILMVSMLPAVAAEPSFDCSTAQKLAERAVCGSDALAALDRQLDANYAAAFRAMPSAERSILRLSQHSWIARRNACEVDFQCLTALYEDRVEELRRIALIGRVGPFGPNRAAEAARQPPAAPVPPAIRSDPPALTGPGIRFDPRPASPPAARVDPPTLPPSGPVLLPVARLPARAVSLGGTVRFSPGDAGIPLARLKVGEEITIMAESDAAAGRGWYQVRYDGGEGHMWAGDLCMADATLPGIGRNCPR